MARGYPGRVRPKRAENRRTCGCPGCGALCSVLGRSSTSRRRSGAALDIADCCCCSASRQHILQQAGRIDISVPARVPGAAVSAGRIARGRLFRPRWRPGPSSVRTFPSAGGLFFFFCFFFFFLAMLLLFLWGFRIRRLGTWSTPNVIPVASGSAPGDRIACTARARRYDGHFPQGQRARRHLRPGQNTSTYVPFERVSVQAPLGRRPTAGTARRIAFELCSRWLGCLLVLGRRGHDPGPGQATDSGGDGLAWGRIPVTTRCSRWSRKLERTRSWDGWCSGAGSRRWGVGDRARRA